MKARTQSGALVEGKAITRCTIHIGETCVECGKACDFGTGLHVNRIPAELPAQEYGTTLDGYLCAECQLEVCVLCLEKVLDWSMDPERGVVCDDCGKAA
jgi:hypothetical protein